MIPRFYIYRHLRNDTGQVFYVGKGANRPNRRPNYERAFTRLRKNEWWQNVVAKHGYTVEIVRHCQTDEEASECEKFFIALYGRREDGGTLVNQTDGGDGRARGYFSPEERQKRSEQGRGRIVPPEVGRKIAAAKRGICTSIQKGDKLPEWWKDKIRQTKIGEKNPMFGISSADHPRSRAVINTQTRERFHSITDAAASIGMSMKTLHQRLTRDRVNTTPFKFDES